MIQHEHVFAKFVVGIESIIRYARELGGDFTTWEIPVGASIVYRPLIRQLGFDSADCVAVFGSIIEVLKMCEPYSEYVSELL